MCFTSYRTCFASLLFSLKQSLVGAGCPGAMSSFAASFFLGCVGGQQLLRRLVKVLFAIAHGTLLFAYRKASQAPPGSFGIMWKPFTRRLPTRHIDDNIHTENTVDNGEHSGLWTRRHYAIDSRCLFEHENMWSRVLCFWFTLDVCS